MFGGRWIIAAFAAAACGSDPPPVASDGGSDTGEIAIAPPAEPMAPAPPC